MRCSGSTTTAPGPGCEPPSTREVFPRSAELSWHHSIEAMTVTTAADQAHLLALLGQGTHDERRAPRGCT